MRDKRGTTESYSFLIGLIITFLMLSGIGCIGYEIYSRSTETGESFKNLAEAIKNLKDGEEGKMPLFVGEGYIVVGFRSDDKTVRSESGRLKDKLSYCYNWFTERESLTINKPEKCKGRGCICLCEYIKDRPKLVWAGEDIIITNNEVCSGPEDTCATEGIEQYNFIGGSKCSIAFIPGIEGKSYTGTEYEGRGGPQEKRKIAPVYYKREGNTIILSNDEIRKKDTEKIKLPK